MAQVRNFLVIGKTRDNVTNEVVTDIRTWAAQSETEAKWKLADWCKANNHSLHNIASVTEAKH
jgi:hypothetical protein